MIKCFSEIDLYLEIVLNIEMGYVFEELICCFNENVEVGDYYMLCEVICFMMYLLFLYDDVSILMKSGLI